MDEMTHKVCFKKVRPDEIGEYDFSAFNFSGFKTSSISVVKGFSDNRYNLEFIPIGEEKVIEWPYSHDKLIKNSKNDDDVFVLLSEGTLKVMGYAIIHSHDDEAASHIRVKSIQIGNGHVRNGFGSYLLKSIIEHYAYQSVQPLVISLVVSYFNENAIRFYLKNGFSPIDIVMEKLGCPGWERDIGIVFERQIK